VPPPSLRLPLSKVGLTRLEAAPLQLLCLQPVRPPQAPPPLSLRSPPAPVALPPRASPSSEQSLRLAAPRDPSPAAQALPLAPDSRPASDDGSRPPVVLPPKFFFARPALAFAKPPVIYSVSSNDGQKPRDRGNSAVRWQLSHSQTKQSSYSSKLIALRLRTSPLRVSVVLLRLSSRSASILCPSDILSRMATRSGTSPPCAERLRRCA
jgi:hypothetical protein